MKKQRLVVGVFVGMALGGAVVMTASFDNTHPPHGPSSTPSTAQPRDSSFSHLSGENGGMIFANDDDRDSSLPWQNERSSVIPERTRFSSIPVRKGLKPESFVTIDNKTYPLRTYRTLAMPNDPLANQWWVTSPELDTAWDIPDGSYQTTLAVIDTGFALDHEEFQGRWHQNSGEVGATASEGISRLNCTDRGLSLDYSCNLVDDDVDGIVDNESGAAPYENESQLNCTDLGLTLDKSCNQLDDDGNDYVDDVRGWDVINQDNSPQAGELNPTGSGTTHGTMVAGVAAATGNNNVGIAGANWNTKILPIQALDDDSYGDTRSIGESIYYAIDQDVDVINISLGTDFQDDYVRGAIESATAEGILVVASSGNDGCECIVYPARYPEVVAVGALDTDGSLASFSSWGANLDLTAPGTNYTVPSWSNANQASRYVSGVAGTSFSSPLVAGIAAVIKSHQPNAQPLHLISALHETVSRSGISSTSTHDPQYGFGKLAAAALRTRMVTAKHSQQAYIFSPVSGGSKLTGLMLEGAGTYEMHECVAPQGLLIYELKNSTQTFYTISEVEVRRAQATGYSLTRFAYACLRQPHDTADHIRYLNIFREFRNISSKFW